MRLASLHSYSRHGTAASVPQIREIVLLAALLAFGVVTWGYFFHVRILGEEDVSLRGPLLHLATDSLLALPPALVATAVGLWLAQRFSSVPRQGHRLVWSASLVSLAFFLVMVPSVPLHGFIDSAVLGEGDAHHGLEDDGLLGPLLHALRDAFLSLAGVLPIAMVGLALLAFADGGWHWARQRGGPARKVSPQVRASSLYTRDVGRREVLKYGGAGAAALALNAAGFLTWPELAHMLSSGYIASPPVMPFTLPLKIPPVIQPSRTVRTQDFFDQQDLADLATAGIDIGEEADFYVLRQQVSQGEIVPGLPKTTFWGYNGNTPGPTFRVRQGRPAVVRLINQLPVRTSTHLHGLDMAASSDGHPSELLEAGALGDPPRRARGCSEEGDPRRPNVFDHCYPNIQEAATLWYHDHAIHLTGRNVYMGLAGFYLIEDEQEQSLPLPRGQFDVPLVLQDRLFAEDGSLIYPCHDEDRPLRQGVFGDVILVNGVPMPFLRVARRKYRFRLLNGSNARVYRLALSTGEPLTVIASDGGLLPAPVTTPEILIGMSERYEVVIDFSRYPIGTHVILENRFGRAFGDPIDEEKTRQIMRFDVVEDGDDPSAVPDDLRPLRPLPALPSSSAVRTRDWRFERRGGFWVINGNIFDQDRNDAEPRLGSTEIWRFINKSGGWVHPIHVHLVQFSILDRNGREPRPVERGRKDSVLLGPNEEIRVIIKFEHFRGKYVIHCHNIEHEDHDMMVQFEVV